MLTLSAILLVFGGLIHTSMVPARFADTEEAFLFAIPTFFVMLGAVGFAIEKTTRRAINSLIVAICTLGLTCLLFGAKIMMPMAFTCGLIVILLWHFGVNPICLREFKKWLIGTVAEE